MRITSIVTQKRDNNRVNIEVDGKYRFSLDTYQLIDLGIKVGREFDENQLALLEQESQFGKVYCRAIEYCFLRPHSAREIHDYLFRKTKPTRDKTGSLQSGIDLVIIERVYSRLIEKKYIDDIKFTKYWVENRSLKKGVSLRKLKAELFAKGVNDAIIVQALSETQRTDCNEIKKIISKKRSRYPDEKKLVAYLAGLGFGYNEIKQALSRDE